MLRGQDLLRPLPEPVCLEGLEPFKYDRLMGINSAGPSSEGFDDREATDEEVDQPHKPLKGSTPRSGRDSGAGESSREIGSASLVRGLLGTGPPGPHPRTRLALPSSGVDLTSILHRFDIEIGSNQEIDVESMLNRCQIDP